MNVDGGLSNLKWTSRLTRTEGQKGRFSWAFEGWFRTGFKLDTSSEVAMPKITAVYIRVSSKDQKHASQLPDLKRWVAADGNPAEWFEDTFTGKTLSRPGMDAMLDAVRAGKIARIVCWRLDRLGRTTRGLCQLFDDLGERKIDLISIRDGFSLASPAGRLHARILASVAEYELEVRAERVKAGIAVARQKGKKWGGSKPGRRWKVSEEQVRTVRQLKSAGKTIAEIARVLGLSRPTVYSILGG